MGNYRNKSNYIGASYFLLRKYFYCISYLQLRALSLAPAVSLEVALLDFVVGFVVGFFVGVVGSAERLR